MLNITDFRANQRVELTTAAVTLLNCSHLAEVVRIGDVLLQIKPVNSDRKLWVHPRDVYSIVW